jgi:mannosyltransferase
MTRTHALAIASFIVLIGFGLRLHNIDLAPLRGDEAFSAQYWANLPLAESLTSIASIEPHPPLGYVVNRAWGLVFGIDSPLTLRLFSVYGNVLGIAAMYAVGRLLGDRRTGVLAALLWAISGYQIWHAQDFRDYGLWAGLSIVTAWLALRWLRPPHCQREGIAYFALYATTTMIFYLEIFIGLAFTAFVMLTQARDRRFVLRWLLVQASVIGAAAAAYLLLQGDLITGGAYGGTLSGFSLESLLLKFPAVLVVGNAFTAETLAAFSVVILAAFAVSLVFVFRRNRETATLLLLWVAVPATLLAIASSRLNVFDPRYIIAAAPPLMLAPALAITLPAMRQRFGLGSAAAALLVVALVLAPSWVGMHRTHFEPQYRKAANWPVVTRYLESRLQADDLVVQTGIDPAFGYYYDAAARELALPFSPAQPEEEIGRVLAGLARDHHSIWVVGVPIQGWPNAGAVDNWMRDNLLAVRHFRVDGIPIAQYIHFEPMDEGRTSQATETVALTDVRTDTTLDPDGHLTIQVAFTPLRDTDTSHKVFVHLTAAGDTSGAILAQDDRYPQDGRIDSRNWTDHGPFSDRFRLPIHAAVAGDCELRLGLYDPTTGRRIQWENGMDYAVISRLDCGELTGELSAAG